MQYANSPNSNDRLVEDLVRFAVRRRASSRRSRVCDVYTCNLQAAYKSAHPTLYASAVALAYIQEKQ